MKWNDEQENAWHEAGWSAGLDWPHLTADEALVAYFQRSGARGPSEGESLFVEKMEAFALGFAGGKHAANS
jgi:hypothetical protein